MLNIILGHFYPEMGFMQEIMVCNIYPKSSMIININGADGQMGVVSQRDGGSQFLESALYRFYKRVFTYAYHTLPLHIGP